MGLAAIAPALAQSVSPQSSQDVEFTNQAAGVRLSGTLTLPQGKGLFPAVIPVSGSGPQNRDEEIMGHKPFFVIADPSVALSTLRISLLAMNGTNDMQVPAGENLKAIGLALDAAGNKNYSLLELEGLNHLFQHAVTGLPNEYAAISETFAPEALSALGDWILLTAH